MGGGGGGGRSEGRDDGSSLTPAELRRHRLRRSVGRAPPLLTGAAGGRARAGSGTPAARSSNAPLYVSLDGHPAARHGRHGYYNPHQATADAGDEDRRSHQAGRGEGRKPARRGRRRQAQEEEEGRGRGGGRDRCRRHADSDHGRQEGARSPKRRRRRWTCKGEKTDSKKSAVDAKTEPKKEEKKRREERGLQRRLHPHPSKCGQEGRRRRRQRLQAAVGLEPPGEARAVGHPGERVKPVKASAKTNCAKNAKGGEKVSIKLSISGPSGTVLSSTVEQYN